MRLTWSDTAAIATALSKAYPETERLSLGREGLLSLIAKLPEFSDAAAPPADAYLKDILWKWMRISDPSESGD